MDSAGFQRYVQVLETRLAKLERLVRQVCIIFRRSPVPAVHLPVVSSRQHSSRDVLGSPPILITHDNTTGSDSASEDEAEAQPNLGPLPRSAYSRPSDIDPLSPSGEQATYSDDDFLTVAGAAKAPVENIHGNARFYGKSSVIVLTNQAFKERHKETGARETPDRKREFWTTPDVSPLVVREHFVTEMPCSGCPLCSSPLPYGSSTPTRT